jgi:hypothetical protein
MTEIDQIWGQKASRSPLCSGLKFLHVELVSLKATRCTTGEPDQQHFPQAEKVGTDRLKRFKPNIRLSVLRRSPKVRKSLYFLLYTSAPLSHPFATRQC